jgi:hypothetical protein
MTAPPKCKAPLAGGARQESNDKNGRTKDSTPKPWAVYCEKFDGTRYPFNRYGTRHEAEQVAKTLRSVGCPVSVEASTP